MTIFDYRDGPTSEGAGSVQEGCLAPEYVQANRFQSALPEGSGT